MQRTVLTYNSLFELEAAAAARIVDCINAAITARGSCSFALAGGMTPQGVYRLLGKDPYKSRLDWKNIHVFFSDERMVPPMDPQSNFGMAHRELFSHVQMPAGNIHRIHGEMPPHDAASMYARELTTFVPDQSLDLLLLGIGADGHTASLFPGTDIIGETKEMARAVFVPQLNAWRVSLTLPAINRSKTILFLVAGKNKSTILHRLLALDAPARVIPSSLVQAESGAQVFMCDLEAASA